MKLKRLTTYRSEDLPNLLWIEAETSEGITGLGETFYAPEAVEAYIHRNIAPNVLGLPAQDIELITIALVLTSVLSGQESNSGHVRLWIYPVGCFWKSIRATVVELGGRIREKFRFTTPVPVPVM